MPILAQNKKAFFDYEILEEFDAGIVLYGHEVKSVKLKRISLKGSYILIKGQEIFLIGSTISPYQPKNTPKEYIPIRQRKLLLTKKEIKYLTGKANEKGLTLVPIKVYTKQSLIKLKFGVAKGKKKFDKRKKIKNREIERDLRRKTKDSSY